MKAAAVCVSIAIALEIANRVAPPGIPTIGLG